MRVIDIVLIVAVQACFAFMMLRLIREWFVGLERRLIGSKPMGDREEATVKKAMCEAAEIVGEQIELTQMSKGYWSAESDSYGPVRAEHPIQALTRILEAHAQAQGVDIKELRKKYEETEVS